MAEAALCVTPEINSRVAPANLRDMAESSFNMANAAATQDGFAPPVW